MDTRLQIMAFLALVVTKLNTTRGCFAYVELIWQNLSHYQRSLVMNLSIEDIVSYV